MLRRIFAALFGEPLEGRSPQWSKVRRGHLEREPACRACGTTADPEVHHIVPYATAPQKELLDDNLITLCSDRANGCHFRVGHSYSWRAINQNCVTDAALQQQRIRERKPI